MSLTPASRDRINEAVAKLSNAGLELHFAMQELLRDGQAFPAGEVQAFENALAAIRGELVLIVSR